MGKNTHKELGHITVKSINSQYFGSTGSPGIPAGPVTTLNTYNYKNLPLTGTVNYTIATTSGKEYIDAYRLTAGNSVVLNITLPALSSITIGDPLVDTVLNQVEYIISSYCDLLGSSNTFTVNIIPDGTDNIVNPFGFRSNTTFTFLRTNPSSRVIFVKPGQAFGGQYNAWYITTDLPLTPLAVVNGSTPGGIAVTPGSNSLIDLVSGFAIPDVYLHDGFTEVSGGFIAPYDGLYHVSMHLVLTKSATLTGGSEEVIVSIDGAYTGKVFKDADITADGTIVSYNGIVQLTPGQDVTIRIQNTYAVGNVIVGDSLECGLAVHFLSGSSPN